MKKIICVLTVFTLLFTGCTGDGGKETFSSLSDFEGRTIGSQTGATFAAFIDPVIPDVVHKDFSSLPDTVEALSSGKVDAISLDMPVARYLTAQQPEYAVFPDVVASDSYGFAVAKGSSLAEKANEVLQGLKENGTIDELEKIWFSADEGKKVLSELDYKEDFDGSAGTLTYGLADSTVPMSYLDSDGEPAGFDLDIIRRIAYEMNMTVKFVPMGFDELFSALNSGKVDVAGGSMSITGERQKSVDFIGPYYEGGIVLVIKRGGLGK